ncbi:GNAT family N-acetyltransferase [Gaetbulibacter saemankumensis]|uniref:GNAT family N-acetyltransferase n=1 Tax=Gaetbulibacter saemankumensis TaxID=311208 RepID=UPI0003F7AB59|nr:GNAT family N-acetyltransferase [Gaetbulibacter saemankumensis]
MQLLNSFLIKQIDSNTTHLIRGPILRPRKPLKTCIFDGDDLKDTIHLGIYHSDILVGVVTFLNKPQDLLSSEKQYQLRGMAVLESYQRQGLGNMLIAHGEQLLKKQNVNTIWCNAREIALKFYIKNGFKIIGNPFNIKGIGTHYVMFKNI